MRVCALVLLVAVSAPAWAQAPAPGTPPAAARAPETVPAPATPPVEAKASDGVSPAPPTLARKPGDDIELPKSEPPQLGDDLSLGWTLMRTMVVLGLVVMLAYLSLNVVLRRALGIRTGTSRGSAVEVLERVPLDQKRTLFVVKAAGEFLLIGGSDGSLGLISRLPTEEAAKLYAPAAAAPQLNLSPFLQKLLMKRPESPPKPPPPAPGGQT